MRGPAGDGSCARAARQSRFSRLRWTAVGRIALAGAGAAVLAGGLSGCSHQPGRQTGQAQPVVAPVRVSAAELARLPRATTFTRIRSAPADQAPFALTGGLVVHPLQPQVLYAGPGKQPVAVLPATELGGPTWVKRHPDRPARSAKRLASDAGSEPGSEPLGECGLVILAQTRNGQRMGEKSAATAG